MTKAPGLEAAAARLARRLHCRRPLDGAFLARALGEGMLPLFISGLGVRAGIDHQASWEILSDPRGRGPALLLRAAALDRDDAAAILLLLNTRGRLFSGTEGDAAADQLDLFDSLDEASSFEVLRLWQADAAYRSSVARISTRARPAVEAA
jgi:hypothetical protein